MLATVGKAVQAYRPLVKNSFTFLHSQGMSTAEYLHTTLHNSYISKKGVRTEYLHISYISQKCVLAEYCHVSYISQKCVVTEYLHISHISKKCVVPSLRSTLHISRISKKRESPEYLPHFSHLQDRWIDRVCHISCIREKNVLTGGGTRRHRRTEESDWA